MKPSTLQTQGSQPSLPGPKVVQSMSFICCTWVNDDPDKAGQQLFRQIGMARFQTIQLFIHD